MKKLALKPGFEFVFALSIMVIIGLPPIVSAQSNRDVDIRNTEIRITNGDTIVNGKNIKELAPDERKQALRDIENLDNSVSKADHQSIVIMRRHLDTGMNRMFTERHRFGDDSARRFFKFRFRGPNGREDSTLTFNYQYKMNPDEFRFEPRDFGFRNRDFDMPMPRRGFGFMRRNVQTFEYTNTGSDGIPTHVSFRVMEASPEKAKQVTGSEKSDLDLNDLTLVPEFTSGKTLLTFSLGTRAPATVKFTDNEGKLIWSDKAANGSFSKSFTLGLNGIYYLEVKQGNKVALKRIVKEE